MEFGNLMSYGPDLEGLFRHSTKYVDKIVGGTNPSRPSGGAPDKISSHFNHKTAMTLHLTILNQRWAAFTRFIDDGRVCLTDNAAERALPAWRSEEKIGPSPVWVPAAMVPLPSIHLSRLAR
jgi:hypothetical protein